MNKLELFKQIAKRLWEEEIADANNYAGNFENFQKDFINICQATFDGIILLKGEICE